MWHESHRPPDGMSLRPHLVSIHRCNKQTLGSEKGVGKIQIYSAFIRGTNKTIFQMKAWSQENDESTCFQFLISAFSHSCRSLSSEMLSPVVSQSLSIIMSSSPLQLDSLCLKNTNRNTFMFLYFYAYKCAYNDVCSC